MASGVYDVLKEDCMLGAVNLQSDTIRCGLLADTYTFNNDDTTWGSISVGNEVTGMGYTSGGQALSSKTVTLQTGNNRAVFDAANVTWSGATFTARYAILYDASNGDSLVAAYDFSTNQSVSSGDFTIQWASGGLVRLT